MKKSTSCEEKAKTQRKDVMKSCNLYELQDAECVDVTSITQKLNQIYTRENEQQSGKV